MAIPVKVLVVDDEEIVLKSMRRILKKDEEHDFQVDTALSAPDGLALMKDNTYDVIITDLMMPQMDGLEFIDKIRATDPNCLIIMITGYATMQTALEALRKGAYDYIAKPFTVEELRSVVKNAARAALMPETENGKPNGTGRAKKAGAYRSFFNQTYASARPDGTFNFGIETAFISLIGKPISLELASAGESLAQGFPFGSITNSSMKVFNLRAPFSGVVIEVNEEAAGNIGLIENDPHGKGWLLHIKPSDSEKGIEKRAP